MKRINIIESVIIIFVVVCINFGAVIVSGALTTTTIDNAGRREYTYCPIDDTTVKSFNGEVDGCPLARVYINDWAKLTTVQQTAIDTKLRSLGFVDTGENPLLK
jgi:hypothetical protein